MKRNDFLRAMGISAVVTPNLFNYTPIDPKLPLDKALLQKVEEPPEQYLGIDRNSLLVEYIALR